MALNPRGYPFNRYPELISGLLNSKRYDLRWNHRVEVDVWEMRGTQKERDWSISWLIAIVSSFQIKSRRIERLYQGIASGRYSFKEFCKKLMDNNLSADTFDSLFAELLLNLINSAEMWFYALFCFQTCWFNKQPENLTESFLKIGCSEMVYSYI